MREHAGLGECISPAQTSPAPTWSQGREGGFFQGGRFTLFAPLSVAFPHPQGVPALYSMQETS